MSDETKTGVELITAERQRQREKWTKQHDDTHGDGALAVAAACYAMPKRLYVQEDTARGPWFVDPWPWHGQFDRRRRQANYPNAIPTEGGARVRMLVKAGALIAAEIDRLQRAGAER